MEMIREEKKISSCLVYVCLLWTISKIKDDLWRPLIMQWKYEVFLSLSSIHFAFDLCFHPISSCLINLSNSFSSSDGLLRSMSLKGWVSSRILRSRISFWIEEIWDLREPHIDLAYGLMIEFQHNFIGARRRMNMPIPWSINTKDGSRSHKCSNLKGRLVI